VLDRGMVERWHRPGALRLVPCDLRRYGTVPHTCLRLGFERTSPTSPASPTSATRSVPENADAGTTLVSVSEAGSAISTRVAWSAARDSVSGLGDMPYGLFAWRLGSISSSRSRRPADGFGVRRRTRGFSALCRKTVDRQRSLSPQGRGRKAAR